MYQTVDYMYLRYNIRTLCSSLQHCRELDRTLVAVFDIFYMYPLRVMYIIIARFTNILAEIDVDPYRTARKRFCLTSMADDTVEPSPYRATHKLAHTPSQHIPRPRRHR